MEELGIMLPKSKELCRFTPAKDLGIGVSWVRKSKGKELLHSVYFYRAKSTENGHFAKAAGITSQLFVHEQ